MKKKIISAALIGTTLATTTAALTSANANEEAPLNNLAASVNPNIVESVSFKGNTDYKSGSENHQVAIKLGGINQPDGTNTIKNGEKFTIKVPNGTALNLTGSISAKDSTGIERATITRIDPHTVEVNPTNFDGAYNINLDVTLPLTYHQASDTTEPGKTSTTQGYITLNGTEIKAGEELLSFTKPLPKISSSASIYGQGFDATTGNYNGVGTRTFEPAPTDGTVELTWNAPEGVRIDTSKPFSFRTNNPGAGVAEWRWGAKANPDINLEVVKLDEKTYTVKLHGLKKGDQGYVDIPLIFDEIKEEYPDVTGSTTWSNGKTEEHQSVFRPTGFDANSNAKNAKIQVKTYVNDANPQAPTGKTSDGQDSDANTANSAVQAMLGSPAVVSVVVENNGSVDYKTADIVDAQGKVVETVTVAPGQKVVWTKTVDLLKDPQELKFTAQALQGSVTSTDPAFIQGWELPIVGGSVKTFVEGQDANETVTLPAGEISYTGTFTNTSNFTLTPENLTITFNGKPLVLPEGFQVPAGETVELPAQKAELEKRGTSEGVFEVSIKKPYELPEVLGGAGVLTHATSDPAKAKAELVPALGITALVGGEDADTVETALKVTVTEEGVSSVKRPVSVLVPNLGDTDIVDPVLTGPDGFEKVFEGVTIKPGQVLEAELGDFNFKAGETTVLDFEVTDPASGVKATNPVTVVVDVQVPEPEPTPESSEEPAPEPTPTPSEEPAPKKNLVEKPVDRETKDTNTASNLFDETPGGNPLLLALSGLGATILGWFGIRGRKKEKEVVSE